MDWQQPAALVIVAVALIALIRRSLQMRGKSCPGDCSCPGKGTMPEELARTLGKHGRVLYLKEDKGDQREQPADRSDYRAADF